MRCKLVSPSEKIEKEVDSISLPGLKGNFEILPGHCKGFFQLKRGEIVLRKGDKEEKLFINDGFCYVSGKDEVLVLF